jgi:hypothetical protein
VDDDSIYCKASCKCIQHILLQFHLNIGLAKLFERCGIKGFDRKRQRVKRIDA